MKKVDEKQLTRREKRELLEQEQSFSYGKNFNRGQTISGLNKEKSERLENRKLVVRRRKMSGFFAVLAFFSIVLVAILSQFVATVEISSTDITDIKKSSEYISEIENYYNHQPIERIRSYLSKENLLATLQKNHPEIKNIKELSMLSFGKYNFALTFRKPVASWSSGGETLYVDDEGVSFSVNYYEAPALAVSDESNIQTSEGNVVASSSFLGFIGKIVSAANKQGLTITKITIPPLSLRQIQIAIDGVPYTVKLLTTSSPEGQINNLVLAKKYFEQNGIKPTYLDLRVEGKGYYK